jgi:hypothetical protein
VCVLFSSCMVVLESVLVWAVLGVFFFVGMIFVCWVFDCRLWVVSVVSRVVRFVDVGVGAFFTCVVKKVCVWLVACDVGCCTGWFVLGAGAVRCVGLGSWFAPLGSVKRVMCTILGWLVGVLGLLHGSSIVSQGPNLMVMVLGLG